MATWPAPEPVAVTTVFDTGRDAPAPPGRLARDLHHVRFTVAGASHVVADVPIPEIFYHRVATDPYAALPFVVAKLNRSTAIDVTSLLDAARAADATIAATVAALPEPLRGGAHPTGVYTDRAERLAMDLAGDVAARAALLSVHPHFEGLDEAAAVASAFGPLDATALALLDEVTFELVATKEADSYGDSSAAAVTATRGARTVSYEVTGGVMPLGTYQAAFALHRDARRSRRFAGQLFTADEVESLTRFLWPSPSRVGASG